MAVSFGDVLSGIGASLQGTGQEFMQNLNTREVNSANRDIAMQDRTMALQDRAKAQQGALVKAVQEDASAALRAMDAGDFAGALEIAHDHLKHAQGIPGYDPTRALHIATLLSQGDPHSIAAAHAELIAAAGSSYQPMKLENRAAGNESVNPFTGVSMGSTPIKPAAESAGIQETRWRAGQLGLKEGTPEYRDFIQQGAKGQSITVNTGSKDDNYGLTPTMLKQFEASMDSAGSTAAIRPQIDILQQLADTTSEGAIPAAVSKIFPTYNDSNTLFTALVGQIAPGFRVAGSGSSSDKDVELLMSGIGSVPMSNDVKRMTLQTLKNKDDRNQKFADIAQALFSGEINAKEALKQRRELDSTHIMPIELQHMLSKIQSKSTSSGGNAALTNALSKYPTIPTP